VDKDEIFLLGNSYHCIKMYSEKGEFISDICHDISGHEDFDIYKNNIYVLIHIMV